MPNSNHPLVDSPSRAAELGPVYDMPVRDSEESGWVNALSLFQEDDRRLQDIVAALGKALLDTENQHLAASPDSSLPT